MTGVRKLCIKRRKARIIQLIAPSNLGSAPAMAKADNVKLKPAWMCT
jgi:hypothetical protein